MPIKFIFTSSTVLPLFTLSGRIIITLWFSSSFWTTTDYIIHRVLLYVPSRVPTNFLLRFLEVPMLSPLFKCLLSSATQFKSVINMHAYKQVHIPGTFLLAGGTSWLLTSSLTVPSLWLLIVTSSMLLGVSTNVSILHIKFAQLWYTYHWKECKFLCKIHSFSGSCQS